MPTVRLYVGNLPKDRAVERSELEEHFEKFGKVVDIWVARQPPGFAFVTMEDEKEAQEAVKELDGGKVAGERIRVEVSKGGESKKNNAPRKDSRSRSRRGGRGRRRRRSPSYSDSYSDSRSSGLSGAQLKRLDELNKIWQEILAERRSQKALAAIANGEGPHFVGNAPQKNQLGTPTKVAGQHFSVPEELDPANASILHMAHPRSREVAMLMAEHARWAQRDALKALFLAASDSNQAFEAARRANEAVMQAMRQPNASFPVYAEKPLPLEPWLATEKWPTDPPDPLRTMPLGNPPPGVHLERLAQWFQLHPRPLMAKPVDHIDVKPPDTSKGTNAEAWSTVNAASAGLQAPSMPHRAPAPVPFLSGRDPYMSKPPPPPGPDDDPDPLPDQKTPPSPGIAPPKGGLPPPLEPPASQLCVSDGILMSSSLLERALSTRRRRRQRRDEMTKFFCSTSTVAVF